MVSLPGLVTVRTSSVIRSVSSTSALIGSPENFFEAWPVRRPRAGQARGPLQHVGGRPSNAVAGAGEDALLHGRETKPALVSGTRSNGDDRTNAWW